MSCCYCAITHFGKRIIITGGDLLKNFVLWGVKKGSPDYTEAVISERSQFDKILSDIKWAAAKNYHRLQLYTYDDRQPDEMKLIKNIN